MCTLIAGVIGVTNTMLGLSDGINIEVISGLSAKDKIKIWNKPLKN